ncbi:hypothetical protein F4777DRAFT_586814 [Nemania sp. FL0916]|nr:hypothetical protein F4777DRAFT_586814 [Nemania sp. FL0916]
MDRHQHPQSSPIEALAVELIRMILSALPDVASLQAAVLSCPMFYNSFINAEKSITSSVLLNQVGATVLPEAITAFKSSQMRRPSTELWNPQPIADFFAQNPRQELALLKSWSLKDAVHVGRLHACVKELAQRFASATLPESPAACFDPFLTYQEKCRIQQALYRFEVYCNLFRELCKDHSRLYTYHDPPDRTDGRENALYRSLFGTYHQQSILFIDNYAPWENEQLGCIHDFLVRAISPAFNDIAEHDIEWGASGVEWGKLYQIVKAETYDDRERALCSDYRPQPTCYFLHGGLAEACYYRNDPPPGGLITVDELRAFKQPYFADPDPGPADIWRWAHREARWQMYIQQHNRHSLRKWGYVMWDKSRLEAMGVFLEPWVNTFDRRNGFAGSLEWLPHWKKSWAERKEIFERGETGWWSWVGGAIEYPA